jgi:hypothetical protein
MADLNAARIRLERAFILCFLAVTFGQAKVGGWGAIDLIFKIKGTMKGAVYTYGIPRSDLEVRIGDTPINPDFALTTRLAFQTTASDVRLLGDLVLLDSEVKPVVRRLVEGGFVVSSIHDELSNEQPRVEHVVVQGHGTAVGLADSIKAALDLTGTPFVQPGLLLTQPPWKGLDFAMNGKGERTGNVIQYTFARAEKILLNGVELQAESGSATTITFENNEGDASASGSLALVSSEVGPISKLLADNGITITAVHSDFLDENPKLTFINFWAEDDPLIIAKTIRTALDKMNLKKK